MRRQKPVNRLFGICFLFCFLPLCFLEHAPELTKIMLLTMSFFFNFTPDSGIRRKGKNEKATFVPLPTVFFSSQEKKEKKKEEKSTSSLECTVIAIYIK